MSAPTSPAAPDHPVELSVVICAYNEEDNVVPLWEEVRDVLEATGRSFEVIFVDDGSTDATLERLRAPARADRRLIVLHLARNYGQTSALAAGIDRARGRLIALLDGDRQNDPHEIPEMIRRLEAGADLVCGWRRRRQDKWLRSWVSRQANALISQKTGLHLHDYGCTLKLFRAPVIKGVRFYGEMHRFIPALVHTEGARIVEMEVNHRPRVAGKSKYGLDRTFRVLLDIATVQFITRYRGQAMRYFGRWAWRLAGVAALFIIGGAIGSWMRDAAHWPPLLIVAGMLCLLSGIILVGMGLLGELGWRIYFEMEGRRPYRVAEVIGDDCREMVCGGGGRERQTV